MFKKYEAIGLLSIFNSFTEVQLKEVSSLIEIESYKSGDILFREGQKADRVYIINSGETGLYKNITNIITLGKGEVLGEMGAVLDYPRSLTAKVTSPSAEMWVISRYSFLQMIDKYPDMTVSLAGILCGRIKETTRRLITSRKDYYSYLKDRERLTKVMRKTQIIKALPLFKVLSEEEIRELSQRFRLLKYDRDFVLFNEGDRSDALYIIKSGMIAIYKDREKKEHERDFTYLRKGDVLGEMGVVSEDRRSMSAKIASPDSELYMISKGDFIYMMRNYPKMRLNLIKILCERIYENNKRFFDIN